MRSVLRRRRKQSEQIAVNWHDKHGDTEARATGGACVPVMVPVASVGLTDLWDTANCVRRALLLLCDTCAVTRAARGDADP